MKNNIGLLSGESQARRLEEIGDQLFLLLQQPDVSQRVHTCQDENEWSVMQILGHMAEMIPFWTNRCCFSNVATEGPLQFGRELDASERLDGINWEAERELDVIVFVLKQEIRRAAQAIRNISNEDRKKKGLHIRYGEMTIADAIERLIVAHAEEHLNQIHSTLQRK